MFRCSGQIIAGPMRMNGNSQSYLSGGVGELFKLNYEREKHFGGRRVGIIDKFGMQLIHLFMLMFCSFILFFEFSKYLIKLVKLDTAAGLEVAVLGRLSTWCSNRWCKHQGTLHTLVFLVVRYVQLSDHVGFGGAVHREASAEVQA